MSEYNKKLIRDLFGSGYVDALGQLNARIEKLRQ
jgi:hypothetical protein